MTTAEDTTWGLLPAAEGWVEWWAWHPVRACGRWRWLQWVQRRRDFQCSSIGEVYRDYRAGRAHDWRDSTLTFPAHSHTHTCRMCGAQFGI